MNANRMFPSVAPAGAQLRWEPDPPPRRTLVVDDDPLIRQLYSETLAHSGYQVDGAEDGAVAWDALQVTGYDLLITDCMMPKVSGVDLLNKINAARMTLPVIMATATFPEEVFIRYPELQPEITLLKPHSMTELLGAVEEVLDAHRGVHAGSVPPAVDQFRPPANRLRAR
jgi:DNA-binding response OmpR family regulator